ncbi:MAG: DNA repair protein RecO [Kiritimatiellae bacterium]|nr:DNA repair protein RecO [Kiritimatiellia bacterium]
MIVKTQAIVLRMIPFSETSRVVLWLTSDHGKIATIIKGAHRRRSPFVGQVDLFYTCELLVYLRLFRGLHIVKECSPLKTRTLLRSRWRATACASYFAELAAQISPLNAPHPELFRVLDMALDYFADQSALELGLFWFELKLMKAMGLAPQLKECLRCHRPLQEDNDFVAEPGARAARRGQERESVFSCARGGILCKACAPMVPTSLNAGMPITPDILGILRFWQASRSWRSAQSATCTPRQIRELERIMGFFMQYHLEIANPARAVALSILRTRLGPTS